MAPHTPGVLRFGKLSKTSSPGSAPQHTLVIHYPGIDLGRLRSALSILEALLYFRDWKYKGRK